MYVIMGYLLFVTLNFSSFLKTWYLFFLYTSLLLIISHIISTLWNFFVYNLTRLIFLNQILIWSYSEPKYLSFTDLLKIGAPFMFCSIIIIWVIEKIRRQRFLSMLSAYHFKTFSEFHKHSTTDPQVVIDFQNGKILQYN